MNKLIILLKRLILSLKIIKLNSALKNLFIFSFFPLIYCIFFAKYGFEDTDTGFIIGMSYRILNGEIPYIDFAYVRPPITLYLNSLFMYVLPESHQVLFLRYIYYFYFTLPIFISIHILEKDYTFLKKSVNKVWIFSFSYLTSYLFFPPMGWHTIDGIVFSSIAILMLAKVSKSNWPYLIFLGSFFGLLALFSKQSFAPIILISVLYIFFKIGKKESIIYLIFLSLQIIFIYLIFKETVFYDQFLFYTSGSSTIKDLFTSGFLAYGYFPLTSKTTLIFILLCFFGYISKNLRKNFDEKVIFFLLVYFLIANIFYFLETGNLASKLIFRYDFILFDICIIYILYNIFFSNRFFSINFTWIKRNATLLALLSVSWMASISWGVMSPKLFLFPVIFIIFQYFAEKEKLNFKNTKLVIISSFFLLSHMILDYSSPYRDSTRNYLNYEMGDISPKLKGIWTDEDTYLKYLELKNIFDIYNGKSTIIPSISSGYYLFNLRNGLPVDWAMDAEINFKTDYFIKKLENLDYIIVQKDDQLNKDLAASSPKFASSLENYVIHNYGIVDEFEFFYIYQK
tara:strand:- start:870 stop:2576 length:1707 start_codon:yes stop_codon:yes gene_type:complete